MDKFIDEKLPLIIKNISAEQYYSHIDVLFRQLINAVAFLHGNGIAHRDIKPANIALTDNNYQQLKLIDFGYSCLSDPIYEESEESVDTSVKRIKRSENIFF